MLSIRVDRQSVDLSGAVSSPAHAAILRQLAEQVFPDRRRADTLTLTPGLLPGWALITEMTLRAVAESYTSTTRITPTAILIKGVTVSGSAWRSRIAQVEKNLLPGMSLDLQVTQIGIPVSHQQQCSDLLSSAKRKRKIEFPSSGFVLSTNSYAFLDELVQIATDCPGASLLVTGHTDNTGEESDNLAISAARAAAVATYLSERGINTARVIAKGVGSSQPLASGHRARDRRANRRIDVVLEFPEP